MAASIPLFPSAARTTTITSPDLINQGCDFMDVIMDTTAFGSGSVTLTINGKDPASGKYYLILSGAAVVSVVTNVYHIGPGLTAAANVTANSSVPEVFQIVCTANNSNTQTYSVGVNLF
jgi:hypothetical protein